MHKEEEEEEKQKTMSSCIYPSELEMRVKFLTQHSTICTPCSIIIWNLRACHKQKKKSIHKKRRMSSRLVDSSSRKNRRGGQILNMAVDLTLASTYLPALLCILRSSVLIVLMSRERVTHSMPILILIGIILYVERILRQEVIFDSSALTCTVFAIHVLNICRSSIAHIDGEISATATSSNISSSALFESSSVRDGDLMMGIHGWVCMVMYSASSILLLLDFDLAGFLELHNGKNNRLLLTTTTNNPMMMMRVSTIVLNCLFVGLTMQVPISESVFMLPWKIMMRSFLFVMLSIFWTYCIGIHDSSVMMCTRSYPYFYNTVLKKKFVQPFTPCQLRFLVLLFIDGWLLLITGTIMCIIMSRHLSNLISIVCSNSSTAATTTAISSNDSVVDLEQQQQQIPRNDESANLLLFNDDPDDDGYDDGGCENDDDEVHHCGGDSGTKTAIATAAMKGTSSSGHHHHQQRNHQQQDSDVVAMFRLAQQKASVASSHLSTN